jgi:hypothetical protein
VSSREEYNCAAASRILHPLYFALLLALAGSCVLSDCGFQQIACAQDSEGTRDSDDVEDEKAAVVGEGSDPPADEKTVKVKDESEEPTDEDQVNEAADKEDHEEEKKAAEEEAAGTEVEIDDSDDEEEEPADSPAIEEKPPVTPENAPEVAKRIIGATATIMEKQSELLFRARIDSGAKSCSLHVEDYKIEDEAEEMRDNIGKVVRFHIKNGNSESHWLEAKIAGYVIVKTAAHRERRYKVPLTLRWKDVEKTVLVTLNNRDKMEFPLLLGRNFLMSDFVVDVEMDNDDLRTR